MEPIKVIVENLPGSQHWLIEWAPIFIAVVSLILSLVALYYSRQEFRRASRPYVWAQNFAYLDKHNRLINQPETIAMKVSNSPAKIIKMEVSLQYPSKDGDYNNLLTREESNLARFPAESTQWTFVIAELSEIIKQVKGPSRLERYIKITYSSLDGGIKYYYTFRSSYVPNDNNWKSIVEEGN